MAFDVEEYAKKRKLNKSTNSEDNSDRNSGFDVEAYAKQRNLPQVGEYLDSSINSWLKRNESFYSGYNSRIGRYQDKDVLDWSYESDSSDWLSALTTQKGNLENEAKEIRTWLDNYKDYLDKDYYSSVTKALDGNINQYGDIISHATEVNKHWSQWETEDAYKEWVGQQVDYNEKLNYDLVAGREEIRLLESDLNGISSTEQAISKLRSENQALELAKAKGSRDAIAKLEENNRKIAVWEEMLNTAYKKYGGKEGLSSLVSEKNAYYTLAERVQKAAELASVADVNSQNYDPSFAEKSKYKSTETSNPLGKLMSTYGMGYDDLIYEYINGDEDFRAEVNRKHDTWTVGNPIVGGGDTKSFYERAGYDYMSKDEIAIYNYYYNTEGKEKAQEYLDSLEESLQVRYGTNMAQGVDGIVDQYIFAVEAGLDQFGTGIVNMFSNKDYIPTNATQVASGIIREDLADTGAKLPDWLGGGSLGQVGYDVINTTSNMLPSILASTAINVVAPGAGAVVGAGLMGTSAGGHAKAEMLNLGYSKEQANAYGVMVGAAEAGMEYLLGGISKLGGKLPDGIVGKILTKVDNAFARTAIKIGGSMLSEGFEEGLQTVIEPWLKEIATGVDWEDPKIDEVLYSSLLGALSAFGLEGAGVVAGEVGTHKSGKTIQKIEGGVAKLQELGSTFSADTVAYKIASKVNAQTDAYTIGRLLNEVGGTISELNLTDIVNGLTERGIRESDAKKIAKEYQNALYRNMNLSDEQVKILENLAPLADVLRKNIIGANTTVYQRTRAYSDLMGLANEVANGKKGVSTQKSSSTEKPTANIFEQQALNADVQRIASEVATGTRTSAAGQAVKKAVTSASDIAAEKLGVEGKYTSSETGATRLASNKKKVNVVGVDSIDKGTLMLKLGDGSIVDAEDIDFSTADQALVYEAVTNMGVNPTTAWEILKAYDPKSGQSGMIYAMGSLEAYTYGHNGVKVDKMSNDGFSALLSPVQKNTANRLGDIDARAKVEAQQKAIDKAEKTVRDEAKSKHKAIPKRKGGVVLHTYSTTLTDYQQSQIDVLERVSEGLGVTFHMFESKEDAKGNLTYIMPDGTVTGSNGWYDPKTGEIWIDINAGKIGQGTIIFTAAHELTHFIKQWSPAKFKVFADFLFEQYGKKGQSIEQLVNQRIESLKSHGRTKGLSMTEIYDLAYEEIVADSAQAFLRDSKAAEKVAALREKDKGLANKIKTFLGQMLAKMRKVLEDHNILPESNEAQIVAEMTDSLQKLYDLWSDALADAGEAYSLISMDENTDILPVEGTVKHSFRSLAEAAGFMAVENEDGSRSFVRDGVAVSEVTVEDIENSPIGAFINYSLDKGDIDEAHADRQKKMFAEICTMACKTNDFSMTMQFMGSAVFTGMKANADKQYGTTYDFPSICTKTQAVIDAMSARMVKLGRGLNSNEIVQLYREVFASGNPVPCPECYVFSRWIGIGGLLDNIKKYQDYYGKMSTADVAKAYREMHSQVEAFAEEQGISFGKAKGALTSKLTKEYNKLTEKIEKAENQGEVVKDTDRKRLAELEPMMNTVKSMTWLENVYFADSSLTKVNKNYKVPNEVLFDLNNGEDFATKYPEAWAFRTTQGAGYGKAITPYAEASLGEGILVTNNTTNAIKGKSKGTLTNYFLQQNGRMDANARKALDKARMKQKIQAFIGGQRFQSTSDARYENASDYLLAALEMQAMHGMVQVYTKVDGAVPAFSAWGFSINQSLMPLGGGLDADGNIIDTKVGGMSPKVAIENRKKHESAGTITIGVNDNHIRAMFADIIRDFIIPYHASGGKAEVVAEFRRIQDMAEKRNTKVRSTDYSRTQSDKVLSDDVLRWQGKSDAEIEQIHNVREARIAILTRGKVDMDVVRGNRFLTALYDKLYGGEWDGVKLAKSKVESQIFPNEFWDQSVTYEESGKITKDYLEYCEDLGFLHRFSGLVPSNGKLVPVNGYDQNGNRVQLTDLAYKYENGKKTDVVEDFFWKVLTDRRMYDNNGNYLAQKVVTLNDTTADTVTTFAKNNDGRQYNKQVSLETAERVANAKFSDRVTNKETLDFLNEQMESGEVTKVYRAMQAQPVDENGNVIKATVLRVVSQDPLMVEAKTFGKDGKVAVYPAKLFSPMAGMVDGKWSKSIDLNVWEETSFDFANAYTVIDEKTGQPKIDNDKKNASYGEAAYFYGLVKGGIDDNGKKLTDVPARYNPYIHTSLSALNDQFSSANKRPELVTVECIIPNSELKSGFRAEGAKDRVGAMSWHSGPTSSRLAKVGKARTVILTRYDMPVRVLPDSEVAKAVAEYIGDSENIAIKGSTVTPSLSRELMNLGISVLNEEQWAQYDKDFPTKTFGKKKTADTQVKYSDRVLMGSLFSGGGTLEAGLVYQMLDKEFAVEYKASLASVYADNHGKEHLFVGDVQDFKSKGKQNVFYLHASPVCKNFSPASYKGGETELDILTAKATARVLAEQMPQVFTVENVKRYIGSEAYNIIINKLNELGYTWDVDVYKASDYGNATKRERMIIRAVKDGELPAKPQKESTFTSWGEATRDLWETDLIPSYLVKSKEDAIKNTPELRGIDLTKLDKPLMIYDTTKRKTVTFSWADELAPTLTTKCGDARIIMPDGKVYAPTPKFMGRIQGLPDDYKYPKAVTNAFKIIGNGIPTQLTKAVIGGVLDSAYEQTHDGQVLYSDRDPNAFSSRSLLANALETTAQNDIEKNKLAQYKRKISLIESEYAKLTELRAKIKKLSFAKGARDTKAIKALQFEANEVANRINTYDRQLLNLESTTALKNVLQREKELARRKEAQKGKAAIAKVRENAAKTQRALMDKNTESRKKAIEGRNKTEMRHKIKSIVSDLNTLLLNPTAKKHIKEELRKEVANALSAINMDTVGADERIAKYNAMIAKTNDPDTIAELTKSRDNIQFQGDKLKDKLDALQSAYDKIKNTDDIELNLAYQEVIHNSIKNVSDKVGNTSIRNMSLEQLEMVYDLLKMIRHTIRDANKSFTTKKGETIMQMAEAVNDQVRTVGGQPYKRNAILAEVQRIGWTFLKPFVAFRTIGSVTFTNLYKKLRNGEDTFYGDVKEAQAFIEEQYKKHNYKSWDMKKTKTFTAKSGKSFELTLEQMMTLYAYSRREQAHKHIIEGGIVFEDAMVVEKNKWGVPIKYEVTTKDAFNLSEETFAEIANSLTAEQKAFVDAMQHYLSITMGAKGNEVSMELLGVKLFKEEFYLPIKSSQYYRNFSAEEAGEVKLKSPAFSKETVQHANNPIVLHNFTDLWAEHINDMSMYHSFVLALEDFTRVYNYKTKTDSKVETMDTKATLETAYPGVTNYINKFLKDMNGGVRAETVGWAEKLTSLAKKGSVLGSASVAIQQPSAVMRAMAMIDPRYFVTTAHKSINLAKHKQDWAELKKYAPIAGIKEMGRFDVGMGQGTVDWIQSNKTVMEKGEDILSIAPAYMDEITWVTIWNAVKNETAHTRKDLRPDSEEFLKEAGERFTDVVSLSQVYDSVFSRSDLMRNKSWIAKALTAFMAEPTTTLNMLWDAYVQGKRTGSAKGFIKTTAATGGAVVASIVVNAALKAIVMAARDDDEDESYAEKYLESFFGDLKDNLNPLSLVPFVKDVVSIFKGYDVERMDMALFSDLKNAIDAFDSDNKTLYDKWSGLVGAISAFFGIPVKNVERDVRALINTFFGDKVDTTKAGLLNAITEGWTGEDKSKVQNLYDAIMSGDQAHIDRKTAQYKDDKAIESAIRQGLRENDPRIHEAAQARYDGDIEEYKRIAKEIIAEGYFSQDTVVAAINSEINAIKKGETAEEEPIADSTEKATSIYKASDINSAFESGDTDMALEVIDDLIKTKVANGMTDKEAKSSIRSSMTSYWKPLYKEAYKSGNTAEKERIERILKASGLYGNASEVIKTVREWRTERD